MLIGKVLKEIKENNLINVGDKVIIGVSGGPDSICLLHILNLLKNELKFEIYVAHINHMLRKEAEEETQYVQEVCKNMNVQCFIKKVDIKKISQENKIGTEEAGRNERYYFFNEVIKKIGANKVATAHNKNDRVETVLLNILRGTGISGLKGIEHIRDNKYIRPLISIEREEIEQYCQENRLMPKIDKSNLENIYQRNKVRNKLIPYIKEEFNPNIINTIGRLSELAEEQDKFIKNITKKRYNEILIEENKDNIIIDLKKFNLTDEVIKKQIILYTINRICGSTNGIEKVNIEDIIKLCSNNIGNKFLIPIKKLKVLVKNKKIFFISNTNLP